MSFDTGGGVQGSGYHSALMIYRRYNLYHFGEFWLYLIKYNLYHFGYISITNDNLINQKLV